MPIRQTQFNFTSGELDPLLFGRTDIDKYYQGAEEMTNVLILPQGGFKRSSGLEYTDRLHFQVDREESPSITTPNGGTGANANDDDLATELITTTNISTINPYVIAQYDLGSSKSIGFVDVVKAKLTSATNSTEFFIQGSNDASAWTSIGDAIDMSSSYVTRRRRVRASYRYFRFVRIGATDLTTDKVTVAEFNVFVESATISNSKLIPFEFNINQSYMLCITDRNIAIYRDGVFKQDVRADVFTNDIIPEIAYTQSLDTAIFVQEDTAPQKLTRVSSDIKWTFEEISFTDIPRFDFVPASSTPAGTLTPSGTDGVITLTASSGTPFSSASVGQYLQGAGGRARIIEFVSTTVVRVTVEIPFYSTTAIASGDWEYLTGFEDVWSSTRGYQKSVTFHENRLWFGGSKERPQTLWGSKVGLFFDFGLGSLNSSDAIDVTLNTDQANPIVNLISLNGNFLVYTIGGEFSVPQGQNDPITPSNFSIRRQGQSGSQPNMRVAGIDNSSIFIQRGGKSILRYNYDVLQGAYVNENISLLSSHLIKNPVDFAVRKSTSTEESNQIHFIKSDGNSTIGTILLAQKVIGFIERETDGDFKNVAIDVATPYYIVQRTIDSVIYKYLEKFTDNAILDSSKIYTISTPVDTFTGLDHLEGETVKVIADGSNMQDAVVSGGEVVIERLATTQVEIGLDFTPVVKTLPLEVLQFGSQIGKRKRISGVTLRCFETKDFTVNGDTISFRTFGEAGEGSPLDAPPPSFTGDKKIKGLLGWSERQQITISQNDPTTINVLSVTMEVNI